jgi:hypothetical protein
MAEELAMMQKPSLWPRWPVLPVKKPGLVVGLLMETKWDEPIKPVVWLTDMFTLGSVDWDTVEKKEYQDFEGLYDDGWRVD